MQLPVFNVQRFEREGGVVPAGANTPPMGQRQTQPVYSCAPTTTLGSRDGAVGQVTTTSTEQSDSPSCLKTEKSGRRLAFHISSGDPNICGSSVVEEPALREPLEKCD